MKNLSAQEQVTALFVIGMYYWFTGDKLNATSAIEVACIAVKHPLIATA